MAKDPKEPKAPVDKSKLALAFQELNKKFGDGTIRRGRGSISNVQGLPTDIATLDVAIGCGGLPKGRIIELFGPESAGKTTTTLTCIASAQKQGVLCAFVDVEHALDPKWAKSLGVDVDSLILSQPDSAEQALEVIQTLAETDQVGLVVLDSVAGLVPQLELDGDIGDSHIGLHARLMSQACRKLNGVILKNGTIVIFINQIREKIGVKFGSPETTPGGRALKFWSSIRIEVKRAGEAIKKSDVKVGFPTKATIVKNKVAPPFRVATYNIMFGSKGYEPGIDKMESLVDTAALVGGLVRSGSWLTFGDIRLLGKDQWKEYLRGHMELFPALREKTYNMALGEEGAKALLDMSEDEIIKASGDDEEDQDPDALEEAIATQPVTPAVEALERDDD